MGKKTSLFLLFLVLFFFALPPIFCATTAVSTRKIEFSVFSVASVALSFVFLFLSSTKRTAPPTPKERFSSFIICVKTATFCFAALMLIFAFFQVLSVLLPQGFASAQETLEPPAGVLGWLSFVLALASAAFFEEALYRQFLPKLLITLLPQKKPLIATAELFCVALFALAHKGGALALLNAVFCAVTLRLFRLKSPSIIPVFASHFLYNLTLSLFTILS